MLFSYSSHSSSNAISEQEVEGLMPLGLAGVETPGEILSGYIMRVHLRQYNNVRFCKLMLDYSCFSIKHTGLE